MSEARTVNQLPDGDAVFLSTETDVAWGHVGGLSILDPTGVEGFGFESLKSQIAARIGLVPRFTWKLREVPFGADRPYWVQCPEFDLSRHVHRIAVPAPGGMKELGELAGHLFARPLDRSRPLWELWVIEGVENGSRVGLFLKSHHCLMDGQAGAGLAEVLTDLAPDATQPPLVPDLMNEESPADPGFVDIAARAASNAAQRPAKAAGHVASALRSIGRRLRRTRSEFDPPAWTEVPKLPFNTSIGTRRNFACATLALEGLLEVKKHFDVKLNDVVLEIAGGALRRYLRDRDALPAVPIVAVCPVSLRAEGDTSLSNQITNMSVALATDLDDPADRLRRISRNSARAKEVVSEGTFDVLAALSESMAPGVVSALMAASNGSADRIPMPGNFVLSNVRGTPVPLYTAGARIESMYPMSVLQTGQGLNITAVSYMGRMDFGFTVDPDLVPDLDRLCEHVHGAFEELQAAVEGVVHRAR